MMLNLSEMLPGLPPISIVTVVGMCIVIGSLFLYMLSRTPELLLITVVSFMYAAVPALSLVKHV